MREPVYRKIVFWISNQRTWIDVVDADMYGVFAFLYRGYTCHFTSRFLLLRAYKSNNGIADGTTWIVSEYALDRALAEYRKINRARKYQLLFLSWCHSSTQRSRYFQQTVDKISNTIHSSVLS